MNEGGGFIFKGWREGGEGERGTEGEDGEGERGMGGLGCEVEKRRERGAKGKWLNRRERRLRERGGEGKMSESGRESK